jgi:hypothetical protein
MTPGQIARLQELSKCYMSRRYANILRWLSYGTPSDHFGQSHKYWLRRLTHQYRNQIAAIKRNQGVK